MTNPRAGFRCYWRLKSRSRGGRPKIDQTSKDTDKERQCPTCGGLGFVRDDDDGHEEVINAWASKQSEPRATSPGLIFMDPTLLAMLLILLAAALPIWWPYRRR
jgi:hypothetical protein